MTALSSIDLLTRSSALARRRAVLESVGSDEDELRERATAYALDADELAAVQELDDLDFLLNE